MYANMLQNDTLWSIQTSILLGHTTHIAYDILHEYNTDVM